MAIETSLHFAHQDKNILNALSSAEILNCHVNSHLESLYGGSWVVRLVFCFVGVLEESPEGENQCVSLYLLKAFYFRIVLWV